jgi:hypothetical protein
MVLALLLLRHPDKTEILSILILLLEEGAEVDCVGSEAISQIGHLKGIKQVLHKNTPITLSTFHKNHHEIFQRRTNSRIGLEMLWCLFGILAALSHSRSDPDLRRSIPGQWKAASSPL